MSIRSASSTLNSAFCTPSSSARRRAAATISGVKSVTMTRPDSPTKRAAMSPVSARPAASSSTVSPDCGSSLRTIHSLTGPEFFALSVPAASHSAPCSPTLLACRFMLPRHLDRRSHVTLPYASLVYQNIEPTHSAQTVCIQGGFCYPSHPCDASRGVPPHLTAQIHGGVSG